MLASGNTREAVQASGSEGVRFTALGSHRLRGLPEAISLYQVAATGLPTRFPPLRTSAVHSPGG